MFYVGQFDWSMNILSLHLCQELFLSDVFIMLLSIGNIMDKVVTFISIRVAYLSIHEQSNIVEKEKFCFQNAHAHVEWNYIVYECASGDRVGTARDRHCLVVLYH